MAAKIPILIFFRLCLLCRLSPVSVITELQEISMIVAASRFDYLRSRRWFQLVLGRFSSFLTLVSTLTELIFSFKTGLSRFL